MGWPRRRSVTPAVCYSSPEAPPALARSVSQPSDPTQATGRSAKPSGNRGPPLPPYPLHRWACDVRLLLRSWLLNLAASVPRLFRRRPSKAETHAHTRGRSDPAGKGHEIRLKPWAARVASPASIDRPSSSRRLLRACDPRRPMPLTNRARALIGIDSIDPSRITPPHRQARRRGRHRATTKGPPGDDPGPPAALTRSQPPSPNRAWRRRRPSSNCCPWWWWTRWAPSAAFWAGQSCPGRRWPCRRTASSSTRAARRASCWYVHPPPSSQSNGLRGR